MKTASRQHANLMPLKGTIWALVMTGFSIAKGLPADDRAGIDFFEAKVRPLLVEHCYECHSAESGESEGGLRLDNEAVIQAGGSMGRALVPGQPAESLIIKAVQYEDEDLQMPPSEKLSDEAIAVLQRWIEMGAPDPRGGEAKPQQISPLEREPTTHWTFVSPEPAAVSSAASATARDVIDVVAETRAGARGIKVAEVATRETLIRRLYFDLTGLPPSASEIEAFVGDQRPDAYSRLVDRLLASPEFGERFGRHWLDVARYADTVGYALGGKERRIKGSHRYRDWVIGAFAGDMPYDEMLLHQLAGDRTDPNNEHGNLDAMGFLTIGRQFLNPLDTLDDQIDVVSRGLLGLTVSCARCHDHKFDPIPSSDYYALFGVMWSNDRPKDGASPLMMVDKKQPRDSPVLLRGQPGNHGPIVPRQFLTSLRKPDEPRFSDGSGRYELAQRITAGDNPLTARVMVNRIWAHLVGKPLVDSPSDFGFRTEPPQVQEVLDDLAAGFSKHWSVKRTVRRIVHSRIYRQSAAATAEEISKDPDNVFLARANRKRRDFESLRDATLLVADSLNREIGGQPADITLASPTPRRTVYALVDRQNLPGLFRTFDFASPDTHSPGRYFTTVPQQALYLLNSSQIHRLSQSTTAAIHRQHADDPETAAKTLFRRVLSRDPTGDELVAAKEFLSKPALPAVGAIDPRTMWSYGTGEVDDSLRVKQLEPFKVFEKDRWQFSKKYPDDVLGHASLSREHCHTAPQQNVAVVRRWQAPAAGKVRVIGQMGHLSDKGDGVQATIWAGNRKLFSQRVKGSRRPYGPLSAQVSEGEFVDFVITPGETNSFDSFHWKVQIKFIGDDGQIIGANSVKEFSGPFRADSTPPLDRLGQLAQILLMSNEFAFVD